MRPENMRRCMILALLFLAAVAMLPASAGAQNACNATVAITPSIDAAGVNFMLPGDTATITLDLEVGNIVGGTQVSINRVRYDLDCNGNFALGIPCTDQGAIMEYEGDGTINSTCSGVTWTSNVPLGGSGTNEIVFTPSSAILGTSTGSPGVFASICTISFQVKLLSLEPTSGANSDLSPQAVEVVGGYSAVTSDALCNTSPPLASAGSQSASLPTCPSCTVDQCNLGCNQSTGICTPAAPSTPCTDTDGDNCTAAGCETLDTIGTCVQTHSVTSCSPSNECNTAACNADHVCVQTPVANSTPCTDTDGDNCTAAGCESGLCVQTHSVTSCSPSNECNTAACNASHVCVQTPVANSTPCTDTDGDNCTTAGCESGLCVQTHAVTSCSPSNECNTAACNASHVCVQTPKSDSTPCTDTDGNACTTAGCESGQCVQTHATTNCNIVCRTPGFWGTHACPGTGCETQGKSCAQNITQDAINACGGCIDICGEVIDNTLYNNADSAVEAICVSPSGAIQLQLVRQLTAAALNCCTSNGNSTCSGLGIWQTVFDACNAACTAGNSSLFGTCINALDCLNNGGNPDPSLVGICATGTCSDNGAPCNGNDLSQCAIPATATCVSTAFCQSDDTSLINALHLTGCVKNGTAQLGSTGSSNECNDARGNACTVIPPGEASCGAGLKCAGPETCGQTTCP